MSRDFAVAWLARSARFDGGPRPAVIARALVAMARPSHLALIAVVAATGSLAAVATGAEASPPALMCGALALLLAAASAHYANEWADHETDALTSRTPFSGGSGALPATGLSRQLALAAALVSLLLAAAVTAVSVMAGWLPVAAGGVLALGGLLAWSYSVPPIALAWRGWGELDNAFAGGLLLPLYGFAAVAGEITFLAVVAFVPFAVLDFSNLLATTWPDRRADAMVGKRTLATRWPASRLRIVHAMASLVSIFALVGLAAGGVLPWPVGVAGIIAVPIVVWGMLRFTRQESPAPTAMAMLALAFLLFAAWAVAAALAVA
jgi:1,4-dihydroxy-2-naphthoate polyprenyltransferase